MIKKRLLLICLYVLTYNSIGQAQNFETFLENGIGVRSTGLGMANFRDADAESAFINPALLGRLNTIQTVVALNRKWDSLSELYFSMVYPVTFGRLGLTYFNSYTGDTIAGTAYNPALGNYYNGLSYSYYAQLIMFSYANNVFDNLSYGANFKHHTKHLGNAESSSMAMDIGLDYRYNSIVNFTGAVTNILATEYNWSTEKEKSELGLLGGLGIRINKYLVANLGMKMSEGTTQIIAGLEGNIDKTLYGRAGYNKDVLALGVGLKIDDFVIDYSYNYNLSGESLMEAVHRFGFSYSFPVETTFLLENPSTYPESILSNLEEEQKQAIIINKKIKPVASMANVSGKQASAVDGIKELLPVNESAVNPSFFGNITIINGKLVFQGMVQDIESIWINEQKLVIRDDQKFYGKFEIKDGFTNIRISTQKEEEALFIRVKVVKNKVYVYGKTKLLEKKIFINNQPVKYKEISKFDKTLEFADKVKMFLQIGLGN